MHTLSKTLCIAGAALALTLPALAGGSHGGGGGGGGGNSSNSSRSEHSSASQGSSGKTEHAKADHTKTGQDKADHAKDGSTTKTPSQQLAAKPKLSDKLAKLLPPGTDMTKAADGFKNLGQFVAAVHVSKNLGIPFADLKTRMVDGASLGSAIKTLKPEANSDAEARKARKQAQTTQA